MEETVGINTLKYAVSTYETQIEPQEKGVNSMDGASISTLRYAAPGKTRVNAPETSGENFVNSSIETVTGYPQTMAPSSRT